MVRILDNSGFVGSFMYQPSTDRLGWPFCSSGALTPWLPFSAKGASEIASETEQSQVAVQLQPCWYARYVAQAL